MLSEASKALTDTLPLPYFRHRALSTFTEAVALHERIVIFVGIESDSEYWQNLQWLIDRLAKELIIEQITDANRTAFLEPSVLDRFKCLFETIYGHSLYLGTDELFLKNRKDRTSDDMLERIKNIFQNNPLNNTKKIAEEVFSLLENNGASPELMYFFRAHLLQSMADTYHFTPCFEDHKLLANILQKKTAKDCIGGTLSFTLYSIVNSMFSNAISGLPDLSEYPNDSLLLNSVLLKANTKDDLLSQIIELRKEFSEYREFYDQIEHNLLNSNLNFLKRTELRSLLTESLEKIWVPTITSLGKSYTMSKVQRIFAGTLEKYGIGEVKFSHDIKNNQIEDTMSTSTPSITGIVLALAKTVKEVAETSETYSKNKPLLNILKQVLEFDNLRMKQVKFLPICDYDYKLSRIIHSESHTMKESLL